MSITLTTDPIILEETAQVFLEMNNPEKLKLLINSVSQKFREYTGRLYINRTADIEEYSFGNGTSRIYVHALPIDVSDGEITVEILTNGAVTSTYTNTADTNGDCTGYADDNFIYLHSAVTPPSEGEKNVKVTYNGGWQTIPGNVLQGAIMQMNVEKQRIEGLVGIDNISREGESVSYDSGDIIKAVRDLWYPYKVMT